MPIRFSCPNRACGKPITVKDEYAGRSGKCPACQTAVKVPTASEPSPRAPERKPEHVAPADLAPVGKLRPAGMSKQESTGGATILDQTQWFVRNKQGWLVGTHLAEVFDSTKSEEARAFVWDGRRRLLGLVPIQLPLVRPKRKFVVRDGEPRGPIVLALAEYPPLIPIGPARPTRWEVRDENETVVGSILVSPRKVSLVKLATKGQIFQDEHFWLDAEGERAGAVAVQRSKFGLPGAMIVRSADGDEYASFGTAHGERFHEELSSAQQRAAEARQKGHKVNREVKLPGEEEMLVEGVIGCVSPERVSDRYTRSMTLAMTVLMHVIGVEKFTGAVTQAG